ncbi:hypothetical protein ACHOLT_14435 [Desulfitobacterium sp. Sab5]
MTLPSGIVLGVLFLVTKEIAGVVGFQVEIPELIVEAEDQLL